MMMTKNFSTFFDRCMRLDQNFSNVEPRERIFLFQSRLLCNSNYSSLSLSFPLSLHLQVSTTKYGKTGSEGSFNFLARNPPPQSPSNSLNPHSCPLDFVRCVLSAQNMNGCVCWCFCFLHFHHLSLLPWQQRQSGEESVQGNTLKAILATQRTIHRPYWWRRPSFCQPGSQLWVKTALLQVKIHHFFNGPKGTLF